MISRIIHQIWNPFMFAEMPREWKRFARSWQRWHPDFEYRLWGPEEARSFLAERQPDFLPIFDAYRSPIQQVDALRVLLLKHFGGIYADLDMECTRHVGRLLDRQRVLLAAEPTRHSLVWRNRGYQQIISTAFMASEKGHPFWDEVKAELFKQPENLDVMDSSGPFLLTRCYEKSPGRLSLTVLSPEHFYPVDDLECRDHSAHDLEYWIKTTDGAYGVHHWAGSWNRVGEAWQPAARRHAHGAVLKIRHPQVNRDGPGQVLARGPLVSCLMVSAGWKEPARWAVDCFRKQSYETRELVVVTSNGDGSLREYLASLKDDRIRFAGVLPHDTSVGALRNWAVEQSRGELLATWEEDDLSGADRLALSVSALVSSSAAAAFMERVTMWWPARHEMAVSDRHPWPSTMVVQRGVIPPFKEVDRGEDHGFAAQIAREHVCVLVDDPNLYVSTITGRKALGLESFSRLMEAATFRVSSLNYERAVSVVTKHVPLLEYLDWLVARDPRTYAAGPSGAAQLDGPSNTPGNAVTTSGVARPVQAPVESLHGVDPPLRFLFAWELGGGLGHTVPLAQIARPLLDSGHEVHLALLDLSTAHAGLGDLVRHRGLRIWQAPCWPAALRGGLKDSASYAELLLHAGYLDGGRLSGLVDGWATLFRAVQPDMLLADHAATALLAARGFEFRRAMAGTGFFDPMPGTPMPSYREWESIPRSRLEHAERIALETCNRVLAARGLPVLTSLQELVAVDEHFLLTVPELDHFERRARDSAQHYYGCLPAPSHGRPVIWPAGSERAVFAYLKGEYPPISQVIEMLKASPWRVVAFLPGIAPSLAASASTQRMVVVSEPVDMAEASRGCDAILCHSGSGTTMVALQAGRPVVMLPMHLEQYLVGRRVQALGAGLVILEDQIAQLPVALHRVIEEDPFRDSAQEFARRYAQPASSRVAQVVAGRCQELALQTRAQAAAQS